MSKQPIQLTAEQKKQFAPFLHSTWNYLSADAGEFLTGSKKSQLDVVIELTTDADRMVTIGKMPGKDYAMFTASIGHPDTTKWLRKELRYAVD